VSLKLIHIILTTKLGSWLHNQKTKQKLDNETQYSSNPCQYNKISYN